MTTNRFSRCKKCGKVRGISEVHCPACKSLDREPVPEQAETREIQPERSLPWTVAESQSAANDAADEYMAMLDSVGYSPEHRLKKAGSFYSGWRAAMLWVAARLEGGK